MIVKKRRQPSRYAYSCISMCWAQISGSNGLSQGLRKSTGDLLYVRNRFINKDSLRAAITAVANAILRERKTNIWGEATSCAGDSKKFGAYDQNLLTEYHIRYHGRGIIVYYRSLH